MEHMATKHKDLVKAKGSTCRSHFIIDEEYFKRESYWEPDHLTLDEKNFFGICHRNVTGLWIFVVYLLGTDTEANNYKCTITITSEGKKKGRCNPCLRFEFGNLENLTKFM